jgi:2-polyprenyl-3-methyl-5-hydroxy-6-metoxy-1,4-benzoquinol methylase
MKIIESSTYLDVTYREKTNYPDLLARWLHENIYHFTGTILDIGCGRGDYLESFSKIGYDVCGIDISPNIKKIKRFKVMSVDLEYFSGFDSALNNFDFIFSKSLLEHIKNVDELVENMKVVLKFGGKIVIMTPAWEYTYWGPFYNDHTHYTPFTKESLQNILFMHNFRNVKVDYFYQLPLVWDYPFLKYGCKLINLLNFPYRKSKMIRFSREVMLLAQAEK